MTTLETIAADGDDAPAIEKSAATEQPPAAETAATENSLANLERFLTQMIEHPEKRSQIKEDIDAVFGQEKAVFVLDMSGFSRTTNRHGIVYFLLMIHQMKLIATPCLTEHKGTIVKAEADNLFCLFDAVDDAVRAARGITERLNTVNLILPEDRRLYAAVGLGFGRILNIKNEDLFGDEVNLASKLGEDIAEKGEILLTAAARARLENTTIQTKQEELSISGLSLVYHKITN